MLSLIHHMQPPQLSGYWQGDDTHWEVQNYRESWLQSCMPVSMATRAIWNG